jgi:hypothetical protein
MSHQTTGHAESADGTRIAYRRVGSGRPVIVGGALAPRRRLDRWLPRSPTRVCKA